MRFLLVVLVAALFLTFTSARPRNLVGERNVVGANNADALKRGLPLPRPRSIVKCARGNSTCFEEFKKRGTKVKRANPSAKPTVIPSKGQNFGRTCTSIKLDYTTPTNPILKANCKNQVEDYVPTTLALNTCIGYSIGLNCASGGAFQNSLCNGCTLTGTTLKCNCGLVVKLPYTLDLNTCVGNSNGAFKCP